MTRDPTLLPTCELVRPRRLDLAVKARLFAWLFGADDTDICALYCWHIAERVGHRWRAGLAMDGWKRSESDYMRAAIELAESMAQDGFRSENAIEIDARGDLLGGAHRLSSALALGLTHVPVIRRDSLAWAPAWDRDWFLAHGMERAVVDALSEDLERLCQPPSTTCAP